MTSFTLIAARNLMRNKRRSLITISAVAFGLMALIFLRGFIHGVQSQITYNIARTLTGDIQIAPPTKNILFATNTVIEDPQRIRNLLAETPAVKNYAERVYGSGVVASAANTIVTSVMGITPEQETRIESYRPIVQGHALQSPSPLRGEGRGEGGDLRGVVIGEAMRKTLQVDIGEKVVVTVQDIHGELSGEAFTLVGTFKTGNDMIDNTTTMILTPSAQRLLGIGDKISRFTVMVIPGTSPDSVASQLQENLGATPGQVLEILTWEEVAPMFASLMQFQNAMTLVVTLIVLTIVAAGTLNTLLMSIIERMRELGLMLAIGTSPRQIILMVGLESLWLTVIGAALGCVLGVIVTAIFGQVGIDLSSFIHTAANFMVGTRVHPTVDWSYTFLFVIFIALANTIVSLYPAWRASRLAPLDSMRRVG
jgi:ABC-type lipoprotein release transport system permease subunit